MRDLVPEDKKPTEDSRRVARKGSVSVCFRVIPWLVILVWAGLWTDAASCADAPDREMAYAQVLSQRGLDALAVIVVDNFLRDFPDHPRYEEAVVARARYQQKMGDARGALATLEEFLQKYSYSQFRTEALCRSAELSCDLGRWKDATERLQALLDMKESLTPEWITRARYYLAWCREESGQYDEALSRFREFSVLCADDDLAREAQLAMGDCLMRLGKYEDAFSAYGRGMAQAKGEQGAASAFGMGMASAAAKEYRRAATAFSEVLRRDPKSRLVPQALWRRADCLAAIGDSQGARACLVQIAMEFPDDPISARALERLGRLLYGGTKAPPADPSRLSDVELSCLVSAQIQAKQLKEAAATLDQWAQRGPSTRAFRLRVALAVALESEGKTADAAAAYARAYTEAGTDPLAADCLLRAADLRLKDGEDAGASQLLKMFLTAYPKDERAGVVQWNLAQLSLRGRRFAEAAEAFEAAAQSGGRRPDAALESAALRAALAWASAGEDEKAVAAFKRSNLSPDQPDALLVYADALARTGAVGDAMSVLRENRDSHHFLWTQYRFGVMCERLERWEAAVTAFGQVDQPSAPAELRFSASLHRAIALYYAGRPADCAASLVQVVKRYPTRPLPPATYAWLAGALMRAGDIARATHVCDSLIENAGQQDEYRAFGRLTQARCSMALRNWGDARTALQDLLKAGPKSRQMTPELEYAAKRALADCLYESGEYAESLRWLHDLAAQSRDRAAAETEYVLAQRLHEMGRHAEAAATLKHLTLVFDARPVRDLVMAGYAGLAMCEEELGRYAQARVSRARLAEIRNTAETQR